MPHHRLKPLDGFLCLFRFLGQFTDIIALVQMLYIASVNTVSALKTVFTADLFIKRSVHIFQYPSVFIAVFPELCRPHHTLPSAFGANTNRNNQGMNMRTALVKMYLKPDNVFLPVSSDTPVIDILRPMLNFLATVQVAVVRSFLQIDTLVSERYFKRPFMVAPKDKLSATIRLNFAVRLERFPAQFVQPFLQTDFKRFLLITQRMYLSVRTDLEIQFHSGLVVVVGRVLILSVNLVIVPTSFILIRLCRAE